MFRGGAFIGGTYEECLDTAGAVSCDGNTVSPAICGRLHSPALVRSTLTVVIEWTSFKVKKVSLIGFEVSNLFKMLIRAFFFCRPAKRQERLRYRDTVAPSWESARKPIALWPAAPQTKAPKPAFPVHALNGLPALAAAAQPAVR